MKKIIFLFIFLFITACSPQVRVTSTVTVTLTPTKFPTQTPELPSQAFLDLQEEVAKSDIYTLTQQGLGMKNSDGTISEIKDIKPNTKDGTFTITYEGQDFIVNLFSIEEGVLTFNNEDEDTFVWSGNYLFKTFTQEQLDQMTDEEKLEKAPETIDEFTKSNISTVKNNLVIYRDSETSAQMVFDLTTGKELTLPDAGIIEFNMKDGTKLEMPRFEDIQESIDYAYLERGASESTRESLQHSSEINEYNKKVGVNGSNFPSEYSWKYVGGREVLYDKNNRNKIAFGVFIYSVSNGCLVFYFNSEKSKVESFYIAQSATTVDNAIGNGTVTAPAIEN